MDYLYKAIRSLCPTSQFSYDNDDYSTIVWTVLEGTAPTQSEIDAEIVKIKENENAKKAAKEAAKITAQTKLAALGLTNDEISALGL